jgi:hypothetical protein
VLHASLARSTGVGIDANVSVRNPYKSSLPASAKVYVAFLNSHGNLVDSGDAQTEATISRGETISIDVPGDV